MLAVWKVIVTIFLLYIVVTDANRARRRRQTGSNSQPVNQNAPSNTFNSQTDARQQQLLPSLQILNPQGQPQHQQLINQGGGGFGTPKDGNLGQGQAGRQFNAYQGQSGYGSQGLNYYPYNGVGAGGGQYGGQYGVGNQYGAGQYGQYGQGMGSYGGGGSYQNQYPGSSNFYSGSNSYNRPGYSSGSSNYYPSQGNNNYGGGYRWNAGQKQNVNMFTVFLSSVLGLAICLIAV